jgi:hypothetical protein
VIGNPGVEAVELQAKFTLIHFQPSIR